MIKSMKWLSVIVLICALFMGSGLGKSAHAKAVKTAKVSASSLNVRTKPSHSSKVIGSVKRGTSVQVADEKYGWAKISSGNIEGWVASQYLTVTQSKSKNKSVPSTTSGSGGVVTASALHLRSSASKNGHVIKLLPKGTEVTILSEKSGWLSVSAGGSQGWVSADYIIKSSGSSKTTSPDNGKKVEVLYDGVNLRQGPGTGYDIVGLGHQGQQFTYLDSQNDWMQIQLPGKKEAWVANWLVSTNSSSNHSSALKASSSFESDVHSGLQGKTIVVDPGHGGYDSGTTGVRGTKEKKSTLSMASILVEKLKESGANVVMTRHSDRYISLENRVSTSIAYNADAFVSLHYNAALMDMRGIMTFYYSPNKEMSLAKSVQKYLIQKTGLADDGVRFGDYYVLRENPQPAILVELGFLSNAKEESIVTTDRFQENAANGIVQGLTHYFN